MDCRSLESNGGFSKSSNLSNTPSSSTVRLLLYSHNPLNLVRYLDCRSLESNGVFSKLPNPLNTPSSSTVSLSLYNHSPLNLMGLMHVELAGLYPANFGHGGHKIDFWCLNFIAKPPSFLCQNTRSADIDNFLLSEVITRSPTSFFSQKLPLCALYLFCPCASLAIAALYLSHGAW